LSSEVQIYSRLYYDTRVKPAVEEAMIGIPEDDPTRITIINKCISQAWKNEEEEIKLTVKKERDEEKRAKDSLKTELRSTELEQYAS
jgi:hypothetical protein